MVQSRPSAHAAAFEPHRRHLRDVAYRFLGSVAEAEDIVQETWLRWAQADLTDVGSPRAFLTRIAARLCLDHLKSARVRRERYVGPWLPEPIVEAAGYATAPAGTPADDISVALMLDAAGITQTLAFEIRDGDIATLYLVRNPDKLRHVHLN